MQRCFLITMPLTLEIFEGVVPLVAEVWKEFLVHICLISTRELSSTQILN
jgi:hypothetical protein